MISDHIFQCMKEDSSDYYPTSGYRIIPGVREVPIEIAYKTLYICDLMHKYINTPDIKILNKLKEMTHEESKNMWELEKKNSRPELFTKPMKKLYDVVEKCIEDDIIRYDDFTSDMIDELTTVMVENGKKEEETTLDRAEQIDQICNNLTKSMNRNIVPESLEQELQTYTQIVQKYKTLKDYVNPNVPLQRALTIVQRLHKEKYLGYKID